MEARVIIKSIKGKTSIIGNLRTIINGLSKQNEAEQREFKSTHGYNGFVGLLVESANHMRIKAAQFVHQVDEYTPETYKSDETRIGGSFERYSSSKDGITIPAMDEQSHDNQQVILNSLC